MAHTESTDRVHARADELAAFSECLQNVYAAASDPTKLPLVVSSMQRFVGTDHANVLYVSPRDIVVGGACSSLDESQRQEYLVDWSRHDHMTQRMLKYPSLTFCVSEQATFSPDAVCAQVLVRMHEMQQMPVFEGFYEPNGILHQGGVHFPIREGWFAGTTIQNSPKRGPFSGQQLRRFALLIPHLQAAFRIGERIGALEAGAAAAAEVLKRCRGAALVCDRSGFIIHGNAHAQQLLGQRTDILRVRGSRLEAASIQDRDKLAGLIAGDRYGSEDQPIPCVVLRNAQGRPAIECTAMDQPGDPRSIGSGDASLRLVILRSLSEPVSVDARHLRLRLGLTPTKADVLARLMAGACLTEIAEARGSTLETIRSYVKSLQKDLGCHSQAQLVTEGWQSIAVVPAVDAVRRS
jgi:DNA-binding CsgD family transcriptional regulator